MSFTEKLIQRLEVAKSQTTSLEESQIFGELVESAKFVVEKNAASIIKDKFSTIIQLTESTSQFINKEEMYQFMKYGIFESILESVNNIQTSEHIVQLRYKIQSIGNAYKSGTSGITLLPHLMETLSTYKWSPEVSTIFNGITSTVESLYEEFNILSFIDNVSKLNETQSKFFSNTVQKAERQLFNKDENKRNSLIESLKLHRNFSPANDLLNVLETINKNENKGKLIVLSENHLSDVKNVYSFAHPNIATGETYFYDGYSYFSIVENEISKLDEDAVKNLPESYKNLCEFINESFVRVSPNEITIHLKYDTIRIVENDMSTKVFLNEKEHNSIDDVLFYLSKKSIAASLDTRFLTTIKDLYENIYSLADIDFAKKIVSKENPSLSVTLMRVDESINIHKVNSKNRISNFEKNLNGHNTQKLILEYLNFDISKTLHEFLDKEKQELHRIEESKSVILSDLDALFEQEIKILSYINDVLYEDSKEELEAMITILNDERNVLLNKWKLLEAKAQSIYAVNTDPLDFPKTKIHLGSLIKSKLDKTVGNVVAIHCDNYIVQTTGNADSVVKRIPIKDATLA